MDDTSKRRVTVRPKCPNPLFEEWLTEWKKKAEENDSKMQHCFRNALTSLRKYPLPFQSGVECKILKGFGDKLCKMLDDKLKQHRNETLDVNVNANQLIEPPTKRKTSASNYTELKSKQAKRKSISPQKNQEYVPQSGSGTFAILVTLYDKSTEPGYPGYMTKDELIENGQHLCNVSFTKPAPTTWYTGWSSMKTLLEKSLVHKRGNSAKFSLTEQGTALAEKLYIQQKIEEFQKQDEGENTATASTSSSNDLFWTRTSSTSTQSSTTRETTILAPGSFEIILLVDTQELNATKADHEKDPLIIQLKLLKVNHEIRNLKVGDYLWICRDSTSGTELVLPYIIERKRMDDLGASIKNDRYHEQKFRLKQCGISNLIYLIESYGRNEHVGLPITTLYQAATNTLIHDGFSVKFTESGNASCEYLACLTNFLQNLFKDKTLVSCAKEDLQEFTLDDDLIQLMNFEEFNKSSAKSRRFKVKEMFVRQLLQIKGMSVDRALAVVEKYQTPKLLKLRYNEVNETEREKLLSTVQFGPLKKNLGVILSKTVYQLFCNNSY